MELKIGSTVDRYIVEGRLGDGGMSVVYLVRHTELGSLHALKVLSIHSGSVQERFLQEGRLQSGLRHRNIVSVTDVIQVFHTPALVMDFVSGPDLRALMERCRLSDIEVDQLARGILSGVREAHGIGLVHRDLKPSNILIEASEESLTPRITDFGLAKVGADSKALHLTRTGACMGTPGYMAPEQIKDAGSVDIRADVFSLGAILYEALTGQMAFDGTHVLEVWSRIAEGEYDPLDQQRPDLPEELVDCVHRALAVDPDQRFPDVQRLLEAWERGAEALHQEITDVDVWRGATLSGVQALIEERTHRVELASASAVTQYREEPSRKTLDPQMLDDSLTGNSPDLEPTFVERSGYASASRGLPEMGNLPVQVDRFFGRKKQLNTLRTRINDGNRLLTLMGPGGMGKTRLSQVFGTENRSRFPGGVWFCDLTEARTEQEILTTVANTFGVVLSEDKPVGQLTHAIRGRGRMLLILDNMEQVVDYGASTVGTWVRYAPDAVFLVTSRVRLGLQGEHLFVLDPLTLDEAIQLFEDRARRTRPDFILSPESREVVENIVERLDRMSLPIELAAARVALLTPVQILERLSHRFRLLKSGRRDQSTRQSTLRGAIDGSWELLGPVERAALAQCSVFRGGFTLEAAEAVLDLESWDAWTMDVIQNLVDQSLLRGTESSPGQIWFQFYESIREYAREKMVQDGAVIDPQKQSRTGVAAVDALKERHGHYYAALGDENALQTRFWRGSPEMRRTFQVEVENLACAMEYGKATGRLEVCAPATLAWVAIQRWSGSLTGSLEALDGILECHGLDERIRIRLRAARTTVLWTLGRQSEARQCVDLNLSEARKLGNLRWLGICLAMQAEYRQETSDTNPAKAQYLEAIDLFRRVGDRCSEAKTLMELGGMFQESMDQVRSKELAEEALEICQVLGSKRLEAHALLLRAYYYLNTGEMELADADLKGALARARAIDNRSLIVRVLSAIGTFTKDMGRLDDSVKAHEEGIRLSRQRGARRTESVLIGNMALVVQLQGDLEWAQQLYLDTIELAEDIGFHGVSTNAMGNLGDLLLSQGRLEESERHLVLAIEGMDATHRAAGGSYRASLAWVHAQQCDFEQARKLLNRGGGAASRTVGL